MVAEARTMALLERAPALEALAAAQREAASGERRVAARVGLEADPHGVFTDWNPTVSCGEAAAAQR